MSTSFKKIIDKGNSYWLLWAFIGLQISVITVAFYYFQIEASLGLPDFWYLMTAFFFINALSPKKYRPLLFTISFVIVLLFFLSFDGAIKILVISVLVFGTCHLPIALWIRKILILLIGSIMAAMSLDWLPNFLNNYEIRIFATIFMFRTILYLHELKHEKTSPGWIKRINYFFLPPNIVLPLFPIVDYQHYRDTYYNDNTLKIYQKGITLISWSVICLLIYRSLYLFGLPGFEQITGVWSVFHYVVANYLTVFRLIGLLTFSVGVLRMFGYNLPPIFNNMFLASSFSDLFKRINIYWKDFMTKVFYLPLYFRLRKKYGGKAIAMAIFITYLLTWFFHSYQWFWVLGANPFNINDIIFWSVFGVFGTLNILFESKTSSQLRTKEFKSILAHTRKVIITFLSMSFLYAMWVSPSLIGWVKMVDIAVNDSVMQWFQLIAFVLGFWIISSLIVYFYSNRKDINTIKKDNILLKGSLFTTVLIFIGVTVYSQKVTYPVLEEFQKNNRLSFQDQENQFNGYYEKILNSGINVASRGWSNNAKKKRAYFSKLDIVKPENSMMLISVVPNSSATYMGKLLEFNEWGFRDYSYPKDARPGTVRIAILGGSNIFGAGVNGDEVFENVVEKKFNETYGNDTTHFEFLNFAYPGTHAVQYSYMLENRVLPFKPDYIINVEHCVHFGRKYTHLGKLVVANVPLFPELDSLIAANQMIFKGTYSFSEKNHYGKIIEGFNYQYYRKLCQKYDIEPIWVYMPAFRDDSIPDEYIELVKKAGFETIFDMRDVFNDYQKNKVTLSEVNDHYNAKGHQLIAKALYQELETYFDLKKTKK